MSSVAASGTCVSEFSVGSATRSVMFLTGVIRQSAMVHVEQEPPPLPRLHPAASLRQEPATSPRQQANAQTPRHAVPQTLHVRPKVKVRREEERDAVLLHTTVRRELKEDTTKET